MRKLLLPLAGYILTALILAPEPFAGELTVPVSSYATIDRAGQPEILLKFGALDSLADKRVLRAECIINLALDSACEDWVELIAMPITDSWDESTARGVVANDSRAIRSTMTGSWMVGVSKTKSGPSTIAITEIVRAWVGGMRTQYGLLIKSTDEVSDCGLSLRELSDDSQSMNGKLVVRYLDVSQ